MPKEIELAYNAGTRLAVLTFPGGRQLKLSNVSREQAEAFRDNPELQGKRDLTLHSVDGHFERSSDE